MSGWSGIDLSAYGLDERVADIGTEAIQSAMRGSHTMREKLFGRGPRLAPPHPALAGGERR